jgi:VWFA-related protein
LKEADWYLHDLRRYVWPLGNGRVLLRRLNQLYEVNANLEERQIFQSQKELLWVSVTPDGKQIIVETSAGTPAAPDSKAIDRKDPKANKERVRVSFLDANTLVVQRTIEVRGTIKLEGTSSGVADVRKQGGNWLVEFGNTYVARVKSRIAPAILYTSANTLVVGRCAVSHDGYNVSAFTLTGTFLWRQRWDSCRYSPVVRHSDGGSRFAAATLTIRGPADATGATGGEASQQEGLKQHIEVLDTATGNSILKIATDPALLDGQNYSLSADGRLLAVVAGTVLDVYALPEMTAEDRARFVAVKSDTPALSVPAQSEKPEQIVYTSSTDLDPESPEPAKEATVADQSAPSVAPKLPESKDDPIPTLTIRTGTQVVALDVVVTDSSGHLVKGLQQSDFDVSEDGKPQTLRFFKEFSETQRASAPAAVPPKQVLPPNVFSNYAAPTEENAVTLVMLDLLNTPLADQAYAQDQLVTFLKNKPKDAKFALCILGNRLQMIQGFTDDQQVLLAAAKGKKASQRRRPLADPDSVLPVSLEAGRATARFLSRLDFFVESVALQQSEARLIDADQRMMVTVDAFAHLARYLDSIPGRKNLVWLSGSFLLGIYPESNGQNPFLESRSYGDNLKKVANLLGEAHVAVYPVDVKGLETNPLFSATSNDALAPISMQGSVPSGPAQGGPAGPIRGSAIRVPNANTAVPTAVMMDQFDQFNVSQMDEHATMKQLAEQTGGQAFYNTNGIAEAIKTASDQGLNYYALSYTPTNKKYDGAFRRMKVKLSGKKYHLAYRSGYYAIDPLAPAKPSKDLASSLARAAMQQGSPQSRQIVFGARVVPIGKPRIVQNATTGKVSKKRKTESGMEMQRYGIDHAVTFSDLRFSPGADGAYHGTMNFMVTAFDAEGKLMASQVSQSTANLKPEALKDVMAGGLRLHQEIDVPVKCIALRLGVEDVSNSHIGTIEIPLPVSPPPQSTDIARRALPQVEPD